MAKDKMTGLRKVAILFLALGPALSSTVMRHFNDAEIEKISMEIANTTRVGKEELSAVLQEFLLLREAQRYILEGGVDYAREILEQIYGPQKAGELIRKLKDSSKVKPFLFMRNVDMKQLINLLNQEHPQTVALIISYLDPDQAAMVLASMPEELQSDITRRVALMDRTSPDLLRGVEKVLKERLSTVGHQDFTAAGGIQTIVDILNNVDRGTEKHIMEELEKNDPELADEIRQLMFVFEDIISLDDNAVQRILRELDPKKLALAIKGTTEEVKNKLFRNMSRRAGEMLREDMEYMGPVRLREVEEAQQEIVGIIRRLDEAGEIVISRGGEDAIVF